MEQVWEVRWTLIAASEYEATIDWLLENQDKITHKYYQMGLDGKL